MKETEVTAHRLVVAKWDLYDQQLKNAEQFLEYLEKLGNLGAGRTLCNLSVIVHGYPDPFATEQVPHFNAASLAETLRDPIMEWIEQLKLWKDAVAVHECDKCHEKYGYTGVGASLCPYCR